MIAVARKPEKPSKNRKHAPAPFKTGDPCPVCAKARLYTRTSRKVGPETYKRLLACPSCGYTGTMTVPLASIRRRAL